MVHSGDDKTGGAGGGNDDEAIVMKLAEIPMRVHVIMLVVTAYSGGTFEHVETARADVRAINPDGSKVLLKSISVGAKGKNTALVMGALSRNGPGGVSWHLTQLGRATEGQHFQECLTVIREEADKFVDEGLKFERKLAMDKTFQMKKDDHAQLPDNAKAVLVCLGWSCDDAIDLDASIVPVSKEKEPLQDRIVYYGRLQQPGMKHSGDDQTGANKGDAEVIRVDLDQVPADSVELYVTVNIYSKHSFRQVYDAYVRLCVAADRGQFNPGHELARFTLDKNIPTRGIVFCKLVRVGQKWGLVALGDGCGGPTCFAPETLEVIKAESRGTLERKPTQAGGGQDPRA